MMDVLKVEFESDNKPNLYVKGDGNTCRLCLCDGANHKIFDEELVYKIERCCDVAVCEDDGFPDHICSKCHTKIDITIDFKNQCIQSDRILRNIEIPVILPETKCLVKQEYLSDDNYNNNYNEDYDSYDNYEPEKKTKKKKARTLKQLSKNGHKAKKKLKKKAELQTKSEIGDELNESKKDNDEDKRDGRGNKDCSKSTLCPHCGKMFIKRSSLNAHMKTHRTDRPFTCDICSKTYFEKWHLHEHKKIHTDVKSYPCEACGKLFKTPRDTKRHMDTVHKKIRAVQCRLCNKYLSSNSGLKLHMKSHTGEKEFQCDTCNRKFISKPCLTLHLRVHTGEKPYSCRFCDGKFAILKTLKEHERIHTGETPYNCPVCNKGFSQKSNMKSHFRYNHRGLEFAAQRRILMDSKDPELKDSLEEKDTALKNVPLSYVPI